MSVDLKPCDLIFFRCEKSWLSWAIRRFSTSRGEKMSETSHVAGVVEGGPAREAVIVEALSRVKRWKLSERGGISDSEIIVCRPMNLTGAEIDQILDRVGRYPGRWYGYGKILLHLMDWIFGTKRFSRLAFLDCVPICSWIWEHAYLSAGKDFGVHRGTATPDDMLDFCLANPDKYKVVIRWTPLSEVLSG